MSGNEKLYKKLYKKYYQKYKKMYLKLRGAGLHDEAYYKKLFEENAILSHYTSYDKNEISAMIKETNFKNMLNELYQKVKKDGYPFTRIFLSDDLVNNMFENLKNYEYKLVEIEYTVYNIAFLDKFLYKGKPMILEKKELDYYNYNLISDYFQEKCRLQCTRFDTEKSPWDNWQNDKEKKRAIYKCIKKFRRFNAYVLRETLFDIHTECTSFRPTVYVSLIKMYNAKKILDISSGWGDRLIGAMACDVDFYCGVDPNSCLHDNYQKMIKFFKKDPKKYVMIQSPFQTANIPDHKYDLVATSPPYFTLEVYSDEETQSISDNEDNMESWLNDFLFVSIKKAWSFLKPNGHMALNINDIRGEPSFVEKMIEYVNKNFDSEYYGVLSYSKFNEKKNRYVSPQPIWIWRKIS